MSCCGNYYQRCPVNCNCSKHKPICQACPTGPIGPTGPPGSGTGAGGSGAVPDRVVYVAERWYGNITTPPVFYTDVQSAINQANTYFSPPASTLDPVEVFINPGSYTGITQLYDGMTISGYPNASILSSVSSSFSSFVTVYFSGLILENIQFPNILGNLYFNDCIITGNSSITSNISYTGTLIFDGCTVVPNTSDVLTLINLSNHEWKNCYIGSGNINLSGTNIDMKSCYQQDNLISDGAINISNSYLTINNSLIPTMYATEATIDAHSTTFRDGMNLINSTISAYNCNYDLQYFSGSFTGISGTGFVYFDNCSLTIGDQTTLDSFGVSLVNNTTLICKNTLNISAHNTVGPQYMLMDHSTILAQTINLNQMSIEGNSSDIQFGQVLNINDCAFGFTNCSFGGYLPSLIVSEAIFNILNCSDLNYMVNSSFYNFYKLQNYYIQLNITNTDVDLSGSKFIYEELSLTTTYFISLTNSNVTMPNSTFDINNVLLNDYMIYVDSTSQLYAQNSTINGTMTGMGLITVATGGYADLSNMLIDVPELTTVTTDNFITNLGTIIANGYQHVNNFTFEFVYLFNRGTFISDNSIFVFNNCQPEIDIFLLEGYSEFKNSIFEVNTSSPYLLTRISHTPYLFSIRNTTVDLSGSSISITSSTGTYAFIDVVYIQNSTVYIPDAKIELNGSVIGDYFYNLQETSQLYGQNTSVNGSATQASYIYVYTGCYADISNTVINLPDLTYLAGYQEEYPDGYTFITNEGTLIANNFQHTNSIQFYNNISVTPPSTGSYLINSGSLIANSSNIVFNTSIIPATFFVLNGYSEFKNSIFESNLNTSVSPVTNLFNINNTIADLSESNVSITSLSSNFPFTDVVYINNSIVYTQDSTIELNGAGISDYYYNLQGTNSQLYGQNTSVNGSVTQASYIYVYLGCSADISNTVINLPNLTYLGGYSNSYPDGNTFITNEGTLIANNFQHSNSIQFFNPSTSPPSTGSYLINNGSVIANSSYISINTNEVPSAFFVLNASSEFKNSIFEIAFYIRFLHNSPSVFSINNTSVDLCESNVTINSYESPIINAFYVNNSTIYIQNATIELSGSVISNYYYNLQGVSKLYGQNTSVNGSTSLNSYQASYIYVYTGCYADISNTVINIPNLTYLGGNTFITNDGTLIANNFQHTNSIQFSSNTGCYLINNGTLIADDSNIVFNTSVFPVTFFVLNGNSEFKNSIFEVYGNNNTRLSSEINLFNINNTTVDLSESNISLTNISPLEYYFFTDVMYINNSIVYISDATIELNEITMNNYFYNVQSSSQLYGQNTTVNGLASQASYIYVYTGCYTDISNTLVNLPNLTYLSGLSNSYPDGNTFITNEGTLIANNFQHTNSIQFITGTGGYLITKGSLIANNANIVFNGTGDFGIEAGRPINSLFYFSGYNQLKYSSIEFDQSYKGTRFVESTFFIINNAILDMSNSNINITPTISTGGKGISYMFIDIIDITNSVVYNTNSVIELNGIAIASNYYYTVDGTSQLYASSNSIDGLASIFSFLYISPNGYADISNTIINLPNLGDISGLNEVSNGFTFITNQGTLLANGYQHVNTLSFPISEGEAYLFNIGGTLNANNSVIIFNGEANHHDSSISSLFYMYGGSSQWINSFIQVNQSLSLPSIPYVLFSLSGTTVDLSKSTISIIANLPDGYSICTDVFELSNSTLIMPEATIELSGYALSGYLFTVDSTSQFYGQSMIVNGNTTIDAHIYVFTGGYADISNTIIDLPNLIYVAGNTPLTSTDTPTFITNEGTLIANGFQHPNNLTFGGVLAYLLSNGTLTANNSILSFNGTSFSVSGFMYLYGTTQMKNSIFEIIQPVSVSNIIISVIGNVEMSGSTFVMNANIGNGYNYIITGFNSPSNTLSLTDCTFKGSSTKMTLLNSLVINGTGTIDLSGSLIDFPDVSNVSNTYFINTNNTLIAPNTTYILGFTQPETNVAYANFLNYNYSQPSTGFFVLGHAGIVDRPVYFINQSFMGTSLTINIDPYLNSTNYQVTVTQTQPTTITYLYYVTKNTASVVITLIVGFDSSGTPQPVTSGTTATFDVAISLNSSTIT